MVRLPLTEQERARGVLLGAALRRARGTRAVREIAAAAGVAEETVRKIERGAVPTPAPLTVAAISQVLDLALDDLVHEVGHGSKTPRSPAPGPAGPPGPRPPQPPDRPRPRADAAPTAPAAPGEGWCRSVPAGSVRSCR